MRFKRSARQVKIDGTVHWPMHLTVSGVVRHVPSCRALEIIWDPNACTWVEVEIMVATGDLVDEPVDCIICLALE